jgi:4-hydroxy-2-oxoglutarate aldolase
MTRLQGIFPPIPTPFERDDTIDLRALADNLRWWNRFSFSGIVALGSNGEAVHLTPQERLQFVEAVRKRIPERRTLIAGASGFSTSATIALIRGMHRAGADLALVLPPFYYKPQMTTACLDRHFRAVAEASPIPIVLYNMPANSGIALESDLVIRLATHENIVGIKDSSGDMVRMAEVRRGTPEDFSVLAGSAGFLLPALSLGADGGVAALANITPAACLALYDSAIRGDSDRARALQLRLVEPNSAVTRRWGVPGLKAALDLLGHHGGPVRAPLQSLGAPDRRALRDILERAGILPGEGTVESPER